MKHFGGNYSGADVGMDEPAHTVTVTDHHALVTSHLVKLRGTCRDGQRTDAPAPTVTAGGLHLGNIETTLVPDDADNPHAAAVREFLREYLGEDATEFVEIDGVIYRIVDIGMRMLQPHELYRCQDFPEWYIIDIRLSLVSLRGMLVPVQLYRNWYTIWYTDSTTRTWTT